MISACRVKKNQVFMPKFSSAITCLPYGLSYWNCIFDLKLRAFQWHMAHGAAAKKFCSSQLSGGFPPQADQTILRAQIFESRNFFLPILLKLHVWSPLIEGFQTTYGLWNFMEEKLHFTPVHTSYESDHDKEAFPPLRRVEEFWARYRPKAVQGFQEVGKT